MSTYHYIICNQCKESQTLVSSHSSGGAYLMADVENELPKFVMKHRFCSEDFSIVTERSEKLSECKRFDPATYKSSEDRRYIQRLGRL